MTIVNAGGKTRIPCLQRVLNAFRIPYTVVYDVDPGDAQSGDITNTIEELVGVGAPFGLGASMPMDPDLPTVVGYGATKQGKAAACVIYFDDNDPTREFVERVKTLYRLPASGIITPE